MSEQNLIPPNPNEFVSPPPVVNPPSSRSEKNLKTKKTTRTMNPKPTNTMKHHDMLNKSTDVNFKRVMTRSNSRGAESSLGTEEMECGDEGNGAGTVKEDLVENRDSVEGMEGVTNDEAGNGKDVGNKEGVFGSDANGCVSAMFLELSSTNLNKNNIDSSCVIDSLPDMPVPVNQNPVLNPDLSKSKITGGNLGDSNRGKGIVNEGQGSSAKDGDVTMNVNSSNTKPLSFSNTVNGMNYIGSNRLKLFPCSKNDEGRMVLELDLIIEEGSKKWDMTTVGYFVGFKMSYRELIGHLKRMWREFHLEDVIVNESGLYFFQV